MGKFKKWIIAGVALAAVAAIGIFVVGPMFGGSKDAETSTIEKGSVAEELILSGEVRADKDASLTFSTSGKVSWIGVEEGDEVYKGQALAKLDTTNLNSALQRARSDLRAAEASVEKVHDDVKNHSSDETFAQKDTRTTYEAAKDKAYEAVIQAEDNLRNSTLHSPFGGIVSFVADIFPGVGVFYTDKIIQIVDPETIFFEVSADQNEIIKLHVGQEVKMALDSFPDQDFKGEIVFLGLTPKEDEAGAVYKVKVKVTDLGVENSKIKIGMTGDAKFVVSQKDDVLFASPKFVGSDTKGKFVRVGSKDNKTYIEVGVEGEERVEITGSVSEGDTIYD